MGSLEGAQKSAAKKCGCSVEQWRENKKQVRALLPMQDMEEE